jgi:glycosyltransferase involved in cell wall biosynthesis
MKVVAIIPAFNEEKNIARVVDKAINEVDRVIVVDDGSEDKTFELASLDGSIPIIKHPYNIGCGASLRTGIEYALRLKPDIIVMLDGDAQHNPEEIPCLIEPILNNNQHLVVGARDFAKMSIVRRSSNILTKNMLERFFNVKMPDVQCGFRAIRTDVFNTLKIEENGYPWACEMLIKANRLGLKMKSVEIETIKADKSSIKPIRDSIAFLRMMIRNDR